MSEVDELKAKVVGLEDQVKGLQKMINGLKGSQPIGYGSHGQVLIMSPRGVVIAELGFDRDGPAYISLRNSKDSSARKLTDPKADSWTLR